MYPYDMVRRDEGGGTVIERENFEAVWKIYQSSGVFTALCIVESRMIGLGISQRQALTCALTEVQDLITKILQRQ